MKQFQVLLNLKRCIALILQVLVAGFNWFNFLPTICQDQCEPLKIYHNTEYKTVFDSTKLFGYIDGNSEIPVIIEIRVVFPAPFGPKRAKISPLFISREIFFFFFYPPEYFLFKELILIIGCINNPNILVR